MSKTLSFIVIIAAALVCNAYIDGQEQRSTKPHRLKSETHLQHRANEVSNTPVSAPVSARLRLSTQLSRPTVNATSRGLPAHSATADWAIGTVLILGVSLLALRLQRRQEY